jgi:hypothetical protein
MKDNASELTAMMLATLDSLRSGAITEERASATATVVAQFLHVKRTQMLILSRAGIQVTDDLKKFATS